VMKKKHLAIIITQSVIILFLFVYSMTQRVKAQAAEREAVAHSEMARKAQEEAERQRMLADRNQWMAEKNAEEAKRQAEEARRQAARCK
jgi:predicted Holliday junction resolvase-like endonuclease